jgi:hypothetical protein
MARCQSLDAGCRAYGISGFLNQQGLVAMNPGERRQPTL